MDTRTELQSVQDIACEEHSVVEGLQSKSLCRFANTCKKLYVAELLSY